MSDTDDATLGRLRRRLDQGDDRAGQKTAAGGFPTGWAPHFKDVMTVAHVYAYPIKHYDHHRRELTTRHALDS